MAYLTTDKKILIVGLGLIGGSYADALSSAGYEVGALDCSREALDYALSKGLVRHGSTEATREYVSGFDLVVLALYPHVLEEWIRDYGRYIRPGAIVTDVTGVKGGLVERIQEMFGDSVEFVPAHPMAGRELSGVKNSDGGIFRGANFIMTPTRANTPVGVQAIRELAEALGFGNVSFLSPEEHDEMVAFLSQLTHCIAVSLMDCRECSHFAAYSGDSFRDLTRIARINEDMWTELFLANKEALLRQMDLFEAKFHELRDVLAASDVRTMKEMMRLSTCRRAGFDKQPAEDRDNLEERK